MSKKVLIISSSPRKGGNSDILCDAFAEGAKNAILMVEYANAKRREGLGVARSAIGGAKARFRAVMMTAWSFLVGVLPLVFSSGAGCESRQTIGLVTFAGMLVATIVGIAFPSAYFAMFSHKGQKKQDD